MTDFEDLMQRHDPAKDVEQLDAERTTTLVAQTIRRAHPSRPRAVRWTAVAAALAITVGLGTWQLFSPSAGEARADEVLRISAINATDPPTRAGQYWEITMLANEMKLVCAGPHDCENSHVVQGKGITYVEVSGELPSWYVFYPKEVIKWIVEPRPLPPNSGTFSVQTVDVAPNDRTGLVYVSSPAGLAELPRDPALLRDRIYELTADNEAGDHIAAFDLAATLLQAAPADLRVVLFEVLADIPGTVVTNEAATLDGRTGVAIGQKDRTDAYELIVDPVVGRVIGGRDIAPRSPGQTWELGAITTRRLVDEVPPEIQAVAVMCKVQADTSVVCDKDR